MPLPNRSSQRSSVLLLAAALLWFEPGAARHEIPVDITVQVYVRPVTDTLHVLVRVPLRAMRDMQFPLRGPGYLEIDRADFEITNAAQLWIGNELQLFADGNPVSGQRIAAVRVSLPSNRAFRSFDEARAHIHGAPLPPETELHWENAMLDIHLTYGPVVESARFSIAPNLARLAERVSTVLRFLGPDGSSHVLQYTGDPGEVVLDPAWYQAAGRFVALGFEHILDGIDHLLFLLCLVIPFRRIGALVLIATAFTVAHSLTLIASALGWGPTALWFPPFIETLIAGSIVYMALENVLGTRLKRRWAFAFGFGLVHGFGFSFALQQTLQFAGGNLVMSLLSFNVGVELGQILVLLLLVPVLDLLFRYVAPERIGSIVISALVAHTAWHWMMERGTDLFAYDRPWWALGGGVVWVGILLAVAGVGWYVMLKKKPDESTPA